MNKGKNLELNTRLKQAELFDYYGGVLPEKHQEILQIYYYEDCGLAEIAKMYGVSRQAILYYINKAEKRLSEMEKNLKIIARQKLAKKEIGELASLVSENNKAKANELLQSIFEKL